VKPARILHLWLPPAALMALLYLASSTDDLPSVDLISDKLIHLAAYTLLGLLFLRAFHGGMPAALRWLPTLGAVLSTAAYGGLDEFHQGFVEGRVRDPADFAADFGGAIVATLLLAAWIRFFPGKP
jgi:VanZ family protein